jgi:hypothetical protein
MNALSYYDRSKLSWDDEEVEQLRIEYEEGKTIQEIGDIHRRTPGGISYRLKFIGCISDTRNARGYEDYRTSSLYAEIVGTEKKPAEKKEKIPKVVVKKEKSSLPYSSRTTMVPTSELPRQKLFMAIEEQKRLLREIQGERPVKDPLNFQENTELLREIRDLLKLLVIKL